MMKITLIRHAWPEKSGFSLDRPVGIPTYTFLHFNNPVEIRVCGETVFTNPNACILYRAGTPQKFVSHQALTHDWIHFEGDIDAYFLKYGLQYDRLYYPDGSCAGNGIRILFLQVLFGGYDADQDGRAFYEAGQGLF